MLGRLLEGLGALLAPPQCAGCDRPLPAHPDGSPAAGFCAPCAALLEPPPRALRAPAPCAAAHLYAGPLADALRRLKYGGRTELVAPLAQLLLTAALPLAAEVGAVVPVPLHPARLRARGFNQAALLARPVARALGIPLRTDLLRRVRATPAQAGLSRTERSENLRGAFAVRGRLPGVSLLLVDDVRTTGATLVSAAEALRAAGAPGLRMAVLAQADTAADAEDRPGRARLPGG